MLIYLPEEKVMFMGDVIMPYLGAPFAEEGDLQGLLDAIDVIVSRNPQHLLHGHEPLTRQFSSPLILSHLKTDLAWLRDQVITAIRRGDDRADIHEATLIPPDLLANQPDAYEPYYILREHVIDRLYDQHVGYWEASLQGLSHPSRADRADLLIEYLGLSESQIRYSSRIVRRNRLDGLCVSENASPKQWTVRSNRSRVVVGSMALARYRLSRDCYSTRCRLAAFFSGVHVGDDGYASADRMDSHEHEKRVVGAAHARVFDRFPGHFQRATGDSSARSDVVRPLWNCSMGSRCNRCQEVWEGIGAAERLGAQSD
jgi:hypothetical protein